MSGRIVENKTQQQIEEEKNKMTMRIMAINSATTETAARRLSRSLILQAVSRFMADKEKCMTTQDVLSTAKKWAEWTESE